METIKLVQRMNLIFNGINSGKNTIPSLLAEFSNFYGHNTHMCRRFRMAKAVFLRFAFPPGSPL